MASVVWSPQALGDVARIAAYIASENPVAAIRIAANYWWPVTAWLYSHGVVVLARLQADGNCLPYVRTF